MLPVLYRVLSYKDQRFVSLGTLTFKTGPHKVALPALVKMGL